MTESQPPQSVINVDQVDNAETAAEDRADRAEKAAFARAARQQAQDDEERAALAAVSSKPGFQVPGGLPSATPTSPLNSTNDDGHAGFDLKGKGWIYCGKDAGGKRTWVKDCGDSLDVPFSRLHGMSPGQKQVVHQLAQAKGWGELCAFKSNGRQINERATQELQHAGFACCTDIKKAKSLESCKCAFRENYANRQEAAAHAPHMGHNT